MSDAWLIVGLGNPGPQYAKTRHNIGQMVLDELDIPFDTIKLKRGGGEGGHNGLRDITKAFGTKEYYRVRAGIGRPPGRMNTADFVLKPFSTAEAKNLPFLISNAADAVRMLVEKGLVAAQQHYHSA